MKKLIAGGMAAMVILGLGGVAQADERFVPKGFSYTPENTELPPVNSPAYKVITEADQRESEIYVSQKLRADHEDFLIHNMELNQQPMRNGWRRY